ncbi:hypothetical protein V5O48_017597 [Marasmius crinis-equi]|uniref:Guanine nucleotide binding protein, alpha subunit n=1 Tax=Marasmius crinis-equi TaxID=585013 RepID=A0ABR3ENI9_9AGAR
MNEYSELSSIYSSTGTQTSGSTVIGLGYLSGRAIKRLGEVVLNGVDYILVNRQLKKMEAYFSNQWDEGNRDTREMCRSLIEFTHPGYILSVRTRSLRLIMMQIGKAKFEGLAGALEDIDAPSTYHQHLSEVLECVRGVDVASRVENVPERERAIHQKALAHLTATREAYLLAASSVGFRSTELHRSSGPFPQTLDHNIPLILYFAFIASRDNLYSARILVDIAVLEFLESVGLVNTSTIGCGIATGLLLHVLDLRLGPESNLALKERIKSSISTLKDLHSDASGSNSGMGAETWQILENSSPETSPEDVRNMIVEFTKTRCTLVSEKPVKLLLVGSGEAGKSTIQKQLIRSYRGLPAFRDVYSPGDCQTVLCANILDLMRKLADDPRGLDVVGQGSIETLDSIQWFDIDQLHDFIVTHTRGFDALQAIVDEDDHRRLRAFKQLAELPPTKRDSWKPSDQDLREYHVWDCGGQKTERRKWIHMFQEVGVLVVVVSLIEYDSELAEDWGDRMEDSLIVFGALCNSPWFAETKIVVFNKLDALERKLRRSPPEHYFPDYTGGADVESACEYLKHRFLGLNRQPRKVITVSFINSLNQTEVEALFQTIDRDLDAHL